MVAYFRHDGIMDLDRLKILVKTLGSEERAIRLITLSVLMPCSIS